MIRLSLRTSAVVIAILLLFAPATTAQNSVSRDQELSAGRIAAARLIAQYPLVVDSDWLSFLSQLRDSLAPYSGRTDFINQIILLDNDLPNAASTPGYLFFTTGLIRLNLDRDSWAFVVAHELAHSAKRHVAIELERARGAAFLGVLVAVVTGSTLAGDLAETLARIANLGHSRELEIEADVEGFKMMVEVGFNPDKAVSTLQFFNEATGRRQEQTHWSGTHPGFQDRVARLTQARQRFLDQGLPMRVTYFSTEVSSGGLKLRPQRVSETVKDWTFLVEVQNEASAVAAINNTSLRLILADGRSLDLVFLKSTFPNEVPSNSRVSGTIVFERPDSSARLSRLIIPVSTPAGSAELSIPVDSGGPFRPPIVVSTLPKPPGP